MGDHMSNQVSSTSQQSITPDVARRQAKDQLKCIWHSLSQDKDHDQTKTPMTAITAMEVAGTADATAAAMNYAVVEASARTKVGRPLAEIG
jgi:hypothetical protein